MAQQNNTRRGENVVEVRGLVKHFGDTRAVDGVDVDVPEGTVLGVLGPNGAGKTTLVRCLSTLLIPDAGTATVAGYDVLRQPRQLRRIIGLTGQYASVDEKLSGWENLYLIGRLLDLSRRDARRRADEMLERFSLTESARKAAGKYSGGMRRRLDLAASLIGRPTVLYLDEPTAGLDPRTRNEVWEQVRRMVDQGTTVLLTTQYMEEAEQLADRLTVIDRGQVIANGRVDELKATVGGRTLRVRPTDPGDTRRIAHAVAQAAGGGVLNATTDETQGLVYVPITSDEQLAAVIGLISRCGVPIADVSTHLPSLDEVFMAITGAAGSTRPEQDEPSTRQEVAV